MRNVALLCLLLLTSCRKQSQPVPAVPAPPISEAENVLNQMDASSKDLRTAEAECKWDHFTSVVDEHEIHKGHVYMRRQGSDMDVLVDLPSPWSKKALLQSGKMSVYEPRVGRVTEYEGILSRDAELSYLMAAFLGQGRDLLKSYKVSLAGWETVDGIRTAKLQLTPLSPEFGNAFMEFFVWIDPQRDIPIQRELRETNGDKWAQHCSGFQINGTIPEDVFVFKTRPGTKFVKGQTM